MDKVIKEKDTKPTDKSSKKITWIFLGIGGVIILLGIILFTVMCSMTPKYTMLKDGINVGKLPSTVVEDGKEIVNDEKYYIYQEQKTFEYSSGTKEYVFPFKIDELLEKNKSAGYESYMLNLNFETQLDVSVDMKDYLSIDYPLVEYYLDDTLLNSTPLTLNAFLAINEIKIMDSSKEFKIVINKYPCGHTKIDSSSETSNEFLNFKISNIYLGFYGL